MDNILYIDFINEDFSILYTSKELLDKGIPKEEIGTFKYPNARWYLYNLITNYDLKDCYRENNIKQIKEISKKIYLISSALADYDRLHSDQRRDNFI